MRGVVRWGRRTLDQTGPSQCLPHTDPRGTVLAIRGSDSFSIQERRNFFHAPNVVRNSRRHRWGYSQRLVNSRKIVVHVVQRNRVNVVFKLLAETIGQPRESTHAHSHREVLAFNVARRNVLGIRVSRYFANKRSKTLCGTVARIVGRRRTVNFHQLRIVDFRTESAVNSRQIGLMAVRRKLDTILKPLRKIVHEVVSATGITQTHEERRNEFGISANRSPGPAIAVTEFALLVHRDVLLFGVAERPNLIGLDSLAGQVPQVDVLVLGACLANLGDELQHCIESNVAHAGCCSQRIAFDQCRDDLCLFLAVKFVHAFIMHDPLKHINYYFARPGQGGEQ